MTPAPAPLVVEPASRSVGNGRYKTAVFHDLDGSVDGVPDLSVANPKSSGFSLIQPGNEPLSNHRRLTRSIRSRRADGFGVYRTARMRRTTSLFIGMPKANVICWAMRGHPHVGSCCFMSTMAAMASWLGRFGPGFFWQRAENSCRYCLAVSAEWNRCLACRSRIPMA